MTPVWIWPGYVKSMYLATVLTGRHVSVFVEIFFSLLRYIRVTDHFNDYDTTCDGPGINYSNSHIREEQGQASATTSYPVHLFVVVDAASLDDSVCLPREPFLHTLSQPNRDELATKKKTRETRHCYTSAFHTLPRHTAAALRQHLSREVVIP